MKFLNRDILSTAIGCGVTMIGLGVYLYYLHQWQTAEPQIEPMVTWFPVACIFIFIITSTLGFLVVPWVMIGELYPLRVRGIVGGMTTMMAHIFVFLVVKTYPFMATALYQHGVFILYGCISFLGELTATDLWKNRRWIENSSFGEIPAVSIRNANHVISSFLKLLYLRNPNRK